MEAAAKVLIVGGVLNLAYGFFIGVFLGSVRRTKPQAPKYLILAHTGPLMQGPILLGLAVAVGLSDLSGWLETMGASLLVASSALLNGGNTLNWLQGVQDEFAERPVGHALTSSSALLATAGLAILVVGVFAGF